MRCPMVLLVSLLFFAATVNGCSRGCLSLHTVFDANANGLKTAGEQNINGWKVKVTSYETGQFVHVVTPLDVNDLPPGTYQVCALPPVGGTWHTTSAAACQDATVAADTCTAVDMMGLCLGSGNTLTKADWMSGPQLDSLAQADFDALANANLVDSTGADFAPADDSELLEFLQGPPVGPAAAPSLGAADNFAVLAGTTITNTGATILRGDYGLSTGVAVTGTETMLVTDGTQHIGDTAALAALAAVEAAYDVAAAAGPSASVAADLGGLTLAPGVYSTASTAFTISGQLTLDGLGDPNAVFVFQALTVTTAGASTVTLTGGAQACNVFWQVASSATLGGASHFVGTLLAMTSISLTGAATVDGRLLARNGAVTLIGNSVIVPQCTSSGDSALIAAKYELSVQLAVATLSVRRTTSPASLVKSDVVMALVDPSSNFAQLSTLMATADDLLASGSLASILAATADLVAVNTNQNFVQASACPFTFGATADSGAIASACPAGTTGSVAPHADVLITNSAFTPADLTVSVGTTVVFRNTGTLQQTVTGASFDYDVAPGAQISHTFTTPGDFDYFSSTNPAMTGVIHVTGCLAACGDPHFQGLDGVKYDFMGSPNETFALISDPSVQINSRFTPMPLSPDRIGMDAETFLGDTCVRTCGHTVVLLPEEGLMLVDNQPLAVGARFSSDELTVFRRSQWSVQINVVNRWHLRFAMFRHVNFEIANPLYKWDNKTHGVLGHTMRSAAHVLEHGKPKKCNSWKQGGCEVEGEFNDYQVAGDLCSSSWAYTQFDADSC